MLGPQPHLAKNAVLTHRPGKLCLDNAFTLIEGHQATVFQRALSRPAHWVRPCGDTTPSPRSMLIRCWAGVPQGHRSRRHVMENRAPQFPPNQRKVGWGTLTILGPPALPRVPDQPTGCAV